MGWFTKKEEKSINDNFSLPDLPAPSDYPSPLPEELPEIPEGLPEIPEIETIKKPETFKPVPEPKVKQVRELQKSKLMRSMSQEGPQEPTSLGMSQTPGFSSPFIKTSEPAFESSGEEYQELPKFSKPLAKKNEPVYIRLDKFEITVEAFNEIRNKIIEIEDLLRKTKEIKEKEEREIEEWEKEIHALKARIDFIDRSIFYKLD